MVITPKVVGTLRQRYAECSTTSKVFNRPHPKMALYGYSMSTTSKVMHSVRGGGGWCAEGDRQCYYSDGFNSLPPKPKRGFIGSLSSFMS
jgi:hypothetical protein